MTQPEEPAMTETDAEDGSAAQPAPLQASPPQAPPQQARPPQARPPQARPLQHYPRCFGCGTANQSGLRLTGTWDGREAIVTCVPPTDAEGGPGIVHGGYVAALVDETMALLAAAAAGAPTMTRRVELDFRGPTLTGREVTLRAWVDQDRSRAIIVRLAGHQDDPGQACFEAKGVYIKVPATAWAAQMIATDRTAEKLDFSGGDPSTFFQWQLDGFRSVYDPARLSRPVRVLLVITDVTPSQWTLTALPDSLNATQGDAGTPDASLECDFSTWQQLTHNRKLGVREALKARSASVAGDVTAIEVLVDVLQRES
jgi:acyl-coenzyme A thioesterase PaaI-like protein